MSVAARVLARLGVRGRALGAAVGGGAGQRNQRLDQLRRLRKGDEAGMTEYAIVLLMFSPPGYGTTGKIDPVYGRQAVTSCDTALDGLLKDQRRRRVSLLCACALHRLEALQTTDALEDLTRPPPSDSRARATCCSSAARSGRRPGSGSPCATAGADGRRQGPGALLVDARPHDRALVIDLHRPGRRHRRRGRRKARPGDGARLVPGMRVVTFQAAFDEGRFDQVLELYPYLQGAPHEGVKSVFPLETMGNAGLRAGRRAGARRLGHPARPGARP